MLPITKMNESIFFDKNEALVKDAIRNDGSGKTLSYEEFTKERTTPSNEMIVYQDDAHVWMAEQTTSKGKFRGIGGTKQEAIADLTKQLGGHHGRPQSMGPIHGI